MGFKNVDGAKKFLDRVWRLVNDLEYSQKISLTNDTKLDEVYNRTVKKVTEDFSNLKFNTAISQMMIFVNECYKADTIYKPYLEGLIKMLSCICPHIGEELWQILGHNDSITYETWPTYDSSKLEKNEFKMMVQVNGKLRDEILVSLNETEEDIKNKALNAPKALKFIQDKEVVKIIVVKQKIVNIVVK